jgi:(2Fe-2S) ferredoxin
VGQSDVYRLRVCGGPRCAERGSAQLLAAFQQAIFEHGLAEQAVVSRIAGVCHGKCRFGPNVFVSPGDVWYCGVQPADVLPILAEHVRVGQPVARLLGREPAFLRLNDRAPWE